MVQNALNDIRPDSLLLVGLVYNDIPDRGAIREVCQDASKADQVVPIPGA